MAHFRERIGKDGKVTYQANIRRRGSAHKGRSFDTIEEAKRWAAKEEEKLLAGPRLFSATPMPNRSGVYIIWRHKECLYIGSSETNILRRISEFCGKAATHYSIVECEPDEILATEYQMISTHKPRLNKLGASRKRASQGRYA